jgi:hypothetical protein
VKSAWVLRVCARLLIVVHTAPGDAELSRTKSLPQKTIGKVVKAPLKIRKSERSWRTEPIHII